MGKLGGGSLVFVSVLLSMDSNAFGGDDCSPIHLPQFDRIPIRDQGMLGDCYSESAAGLVDAWRFSHEAPLGDDFYNHLTSPQMAAAQWAASGLFHTDFSKGGFVCPVVKQIQKHDSCDSDVILSALGDDVGLDFLTRFYKTHSFYQDNYEDNALASEMALALFRASIWSISDPDIEPPPMDELRDIMKISDAPKSVSALLNSYCMRKPWQRVNEDIVCHSEMVFSTKDTINDIQDQLEAGQPAAISICAEVLESGAKAATRDWLHCEGHSLLVIGQRKRKGQCEFLLRNSWGRVCDYSKEWQCEKGDLWINANAIIKSTYGVQFLEAPDDRESEFGN